MGANVKIQSSIPGWLDRKDRIARNDAAMLIASVVQNVLKENYASTTIKNKNTGEPMVAGFVNPGIVSRIDYVGVSCPSAQMEILFGHVKDAEEDHIQIAPVTFNTADLPDDDYE